ncbi:MAG: NAD kinase [Cyclobacteriaceae bacterium]|nr:NAD kinase [Cyclobacteriaceae bacterium]
MNIGIHGKKFDKEQEGLIREVFETLESARANLFVSKSYKKHIEKYNFQYECATYCKGDDISHLDVLITLGGDGTLLDAVTHVGNQGVPIFGINTGRLGFLATTTKDDIKGSLKNLFEKKYTIDERALLTLNSNQNLFEDNNFALNDFTILKKDSSSMIIVHAYVNGELLNDYWADGILVSTPTGSTGYSLSCGGPLIHPRSHNFVITPVSPHSLTARPVVVPDESVLSFKIEGRSHAFLVSLDSRFETVDDTIELEVRKADFKVKLLVTEGNSFISTIRQKLNWGLDARN